MSYMRLKSRNLMYTCLLRPSICTMDTSFFHRNMLYIHWCMSYAVIRGLFGSKAHTSVLSSSIILPCFSHSTHTFPQPYWFSKHCTKLSLPRTRCTLTHAPLSTTVPCRVSKQTLDPGTVRLVAQRLNHYATPGPLVICTGQI
jgi:hypothetical protein